MLKYLMLSIAMFVVSNTESSANKVSLLPLEEKSSIHTLDQDQDKRMSVWYNEYKVLCFRCALPGSECYTFNTYCFD